MSSGWERQLVSHTVRDESVISNATMITENFRFDWDGNGPPTAIDGGYTHYSVKTQTR